MAKDKRKHELMKRALELSRDDPDSAKYWYVRLNKGDRDLLDNGLKELTSKLTTIQGCVTAPKLILEQALAVL